MGMITLRLDLALQKELDLESKVSKISRSEVLRQALKDYLAKRAQRKFRAELIKAASFRNVEDDRALAEEFLPLENEALMAAEGVPSTFGKRKKTRR